MAVVQIPPARTLMVRGDGKLIRHDRKVVVFPDWKQMTERYSGTISFVWGGLADTHTYENNYLTWIEPWQTKPTVPPGGTVPLSIPLPPVYVLNMFNRSYEEFDAAVSLCEAQFGVSFVRSRFNGQEIRCAWAYAQAEGASESEKVLPGYWCCSRGIDQYAYESEENSSFNGLVAALALKVSGRDMYGFVCGNDGPTDESPPVFASSIMQGLSAGSDSATCEGIKLYYGDGSECPFPGMSSSDSMTSPYVQAYIEIRDLVPAMLPMYTVYRRAAGFFARYRTNGSLDIPGALSGVSGRPFAEASF